MMRAFALLLIACCASSCSKTVDCINYDNVDPLLICPTNFNPVCGCDGVTYHNDCYAQKNGVVSWFGGPCP